mmetsp:Transcript_98155/g.253839  ORF Transcript_98155/g.253839 Transcript_98155/m.253839 type:complete len:513 (-) Transcript_98155:689-2227(-)
MYGIGRNDGGSETTDAPSSSVSVKSPGDLSTKPAQERRRRLLGLPGLMAIGFFWISGGSYGIEELMSAGPPLYTISFVVLVGLTFALPQALMTAELATAHAEDGGLVAWVMEACGTAIGGHNAAWIWLTNLLDAAVYPQMAAKYMASASNLPAGGQQAVVLSIISSITLMNLRGVQCVSTSQMIMFVVSLTPCLLLIAFGIPQLAAHPVSLSSEGHVDWATLLPWVVWLYSGVVCFGSMAGEVDRPQKTYPRVVAVLLPLTIVLNTVPLVICLSVDPNPDHFEPGYFGVIAGRLAGHWLQSLFAVGATTSCFGLYHSQIITAERCIVPFFAAPDEAASQLAITESGGNPCGGSTGDSRANFFVRAASLPAVARAVAWLRDVPSGGGAPRVSILFNAFPQVLLMSVNYQVIVQVEMMLFSLSNVLFLYAFLRLRLQRLSRPAFEVPGGIWVAVGMSVPSLMISIGVLGFSLQEPSKAVAFASLLLAGLVIHAIYYFADRAPPVANAGRAQVSG